MTTSWKVTEFHLGQYLKLFKFLIKACVNSTNKVELVFLVNFGITITTIQRKLQYTLTASSVHFWVSHSTIPNALTFGETE